MYKTPRIGIVILQHFQNSRHIMEMKWNSMTKNMNRQIKTKEN